VRRSAIEKTTDLQDISAAREWPALAQVQDGLTRAKEKVMVSKAFDLQTACLQSSAQLLKPHG